MRLVPALSIAALLVAMTAGPAQAQPASPAPPELSLDATYELSAQTDHTDYRLTGPAVTTTVGGLGAIGLAVGALLSRYVGVLERCDGDLCSQADFSGLLATLVAIPLTVAIIGAVFLGKRVRERRARESDVALLDGSLRLTYW